MATNDLDANTVSDVVGDRVRARRKAYRWKVQKLAELCAQAGRPELTANALYLLEGGRHKGGRRTRQITVDELVVLADVFGCPVEDLLFPRRADCRRCHGEPPFGFTCNTCGAIGER